MVAATNARSGAGAELPRGAARFAHEVGMPGLVPVRGAPDSALVASNRRAWDAVKRRDTAGLFRETGPDWQYVTPFGISRPTQADFARELSRCETRSYAIDSATATPLGGGAAVLTYRVTVEQVCDGHKAPTPLYITQERERRDGRWRLANHTEIPAGPPGR